MLTITCDLDAATDGASGPEGGRLCCDAAVLNCASLLSPMYIPGGGYICTNSVNEVCETDGEAGGAPGPLYLHGVPGMDADGDDTHHCLVGVDCADVT